MSASRTRMVVLLIPGSRSKRVMPGGEMTVIEILIAVLAGYTMLLLVLEAVIWKVQPDMENGVTLFIKRGDTTVIRKLYGFDHRNKLYVSSNHWFRQWYNAVLENPSIDVERDGNRSPHTAVPVGGAELAEIAEVYKMGILFRLLCGFAPRRFLRLDPGAADGG